MRTTFLSFILVIIFGFPTARAQWTKVGGPSGMTVTHFFESNGALFVGTEAKGVYKSTDQGATWSAANNGIENKWVLSLDADASYLYAGTLAEGVFRSADQGVTWSPANAGIQTKAVNCMVSAAGFLFAGTIGTGVWKSPDHGTTWTEANGGALTSSYIFTMVYRAPRLEVEADNYLYWSTDQGASWNVDQGTTAFYVIKNFLQKGDTVIASAGGNIFRAFDGTVTWGNVITVNPNIDIAGLARAGNTIYAGYARGVYRSMNWGQTWTAVPSTGSRFGNRQVNHFFITASGVFLLSFEEIGVYRSTDQGVTWTQSLDGFEAASAIDNCMIASGSTVISGTHDDGVYRSLDNGDSWSKIGTTNALDTLSNGIVFAMLEVQPGLLLAGTCGYGLYRSADNGATWTHITSGLPVQIGTGFSCINALAHAGSNIVATTTAGVYYSTDLGLSWNSTSLSGPQIQASGAAANGTVVCVGVQSGAPTGVWRSTNSGVTWTQAGSLPDVISLAADGGYFYAGSFDQNYRSTNNSMTWNPVGPGIPAGSGGFCVIAIGADVFVGNSQGIYHSSDHGASFTNAGQGLDPYPNNAVQGFTANNEFIFAGLYRDAIWRRPLSDFSISTGVAEINDAQGIAMRVAPNPMEDQLHVQLSGPVDSATSLELFDMVGREVLAPVILPSGTAETTVDMSAINAGAYVLRLIESVSGRTIATVRVVKDH